MMYLSCPDMCGFEYIYDLKTKKTLTVAAWRLEKQASGWKPASLNARSSWENLGKENKWVEYYPRPKSAVTSTTEENVQLY